MMRLPSGSAMHGDALAPRHVAPARRRPEAGLVAARVDRVDGVDVRRTARSGGRTRAAAGGLDRRTAHPAEADVGVADVERDVARLALRREAECLDAAEQVAVERQRPLQVLARQHREQLHSRSRSTSAPAGSGPEPWGAIANPSLSPSAPVMCEPWRSVGKRLGDAVGARHQLGDEERRAAVGRAGGLGRAGRARAAGRRRPRRCRRRSAGRDEQRHADDRRQRVAGEPEHERPAAAAEPQRLAGLDPYAPEDLLDAAGLERALDVVVRADRDAAGDDSTSASSPRSTAARVASASSPTRAAGSTIAPARSASSASPRGRWTRRSCPAPAARPAAAARRRSRSRAARPSAAPRRSRRPRDASAEMRGSVEHVAGAREHVAGVHVLAAPAHVQARR